MFEIRLRFGWVRLQPGLRVVVGICAVLLVLGAGAVGLTALPTFRTQPQFVPPIAEPADALQAPAETTPAETTPAETTPAGTTPAGVTPAQTKPAKTTPAQTKPAKTTPAQTTPAQTTPPRTAGPKDLRTPRTARTSRTATPSPSRKAPVAPKAPAKPVITTRTDTETQKIPYATRVVHDPTLASGSRQVQVPGVAGQRTVRYLVTLTNGHPGTRRLLDSTVTRRPQQRIVALGTQSSDQWDDQGDGTDPRWDHGPRWDDGDRFDHCGPLCMP